MTSLDSTPVRVQKAKGTTMKNPGRFRESNERLRTEDSLRRVTARTKVDQKKVAGRIQSFTVTTKEALKTPVSISQKVRMFPKEIFKLSIYFLKVFPLWPLLSSPSFFTNEAIILFTFRAHIATEE